MVGRSLLLTCALAAAAHADNPKLVKARAAIDAVSYDQAQSLLVAALQVGDGSPVEVAEIYKLSASTAIVLGQREVAERYYRRWLALEPSATLPDSVAPKLRSPFVAAQAYMAAHGRLSATISRRGESLIIAVDSDPLDMVAAIGADDGKVALGADHRAKLPGATKRITILDEFGNHLVELEPPPAEPEPEAERPRASGLGPQTSDLGPQTADLASNEVSFVRRPLVWVVPAAVFGGVAAGFAFAGRDADSQLTDVIAHSGEHYFGEADDLRTRRDRDQLVSDVAAVASAACIVVALTVYVTRPSPRVSATASGVAIRW